MVLRKEAERCTRCRRRGWRRSSEALRRRCRRPALCGSLAGILLLVTARHGDPRRRVPPRRRRDPQLRRQVRFGWAGTQDGASQAWNLQLRSPETGTHAYGTYWRGPTLTVRGPTVAIPPCFLPFGSIFPAAYFSVRPLKLFPGNFPSEIYLFQTKSHTPKRSKPTPICPLAQEHTRHVKRTTVANADVMPARRSATPAARLPARVARMVVPGAGTTAKPRFLARHPLISLGARATFWLG